MITVERLCQCGGRLYAKARDEEESRAKVEEFLRTHTGREPDGTVHRSIKPWQYWPMMKKRQAAEREAAEVEAERIHGELAESPTE